MVGGSRTTKTPIEGKDGNRPDIVSVDGVDCLAVYDESGGGGGGGDASAANQLLEIAELQAIKEYVDQLETLLGLVAKENAALFPFVVGLYVYEFKQQERLHWLKRTIPLWIVTCLVGALAVYIRTSSGSYGKGYLTVTWNGLRQFWETMLTFIGPDILYIKMVYLEGTRYLIPIWGAILLCLVFAFFLWKIPRIYRFE